MFLLFILPLCQISLSMCLFLFESSLDTHRKISWKLHKYFTDFAENIFYIVNISAKSSWIFTNLSGNLPVGIPRRLNQKTKTNAQRNKHRFLDWQCLSQIKSNLYKTFRKSSCVGSPKMIQTKNKQTNKQTNKYINKQTNKKTKILF